MEYFEGINLGEVDNEPNTVIKYEQQSSSNKPVSNLKLLCHSFGMGFRIRSKKSLDF